MNFKKVIFIQCLFLTTLSLFAPKVIQIDEVPDGSQSIFYKIRQAHPEIDNPVKKKKSRTSAPFFNDSQDSQQASQIRSKFARNKELPDDSKIETGSKASTFERLRGFPSRDSVENFDLASLKDLPSLAAKSSFKNEVSRKKTTGTRQSPVKKSRKYPKKAQKEEIPSVEKANADLKSIKDTIAESISNALMEVRQDVKSSDGQLLSYGRIWRDQELDDYNESRKIWAEGLSDENISKLKELGKKYLPGGAQNDLLMNLEKSNEVIKKAIDKEKGQLPTPEETFSKRRRQISQPLDVTDF